MFRRPLLPLLAAIALIAGPVRMVVAADEQVYADLEAIAGEPLTVVRFFRVRGWQSLHERALVLWLGREEPYLIDLRERCSGIEKEIWLRLADFQRPGRNQLRARGSSILLRDGRACRIRQIRALDHEALLKLDMRFRPPETGSPPQPPSPLPRETP
ncbi:MAG: hypothetical protein IT479_06595 [Xanthomonadales bacterium]|nr:hypothetical protein [Xanthomonadales bacterium]MCC6592928.1 hypothetical protein [Xanthomonadales bacterium]